jgi:lysophospholipase L1-like esterase
MGIFGGLVFLLPKQVGHYFLTEIQRNTVDSSLFIKDDPLPDTIFEVNTDTTLVDSLFIPSPKDTLLTVASNFLTLPAVTHRQLNHFFEKAASAEDNQQIIRVLHMGDSQIEGDRITRFIRQVFQEKYGGSGPGLFTVVDPQKLNPSIWLDQYGEWTVQHIYQQSKQLENQQYGLMGTVARSFPGTQSGFMFRPSPWAEPRAKNYFKVRLFLGSIKDTLYLNGYIHKSHIIADTLLKSEGITEINWEFEDHVPRLRLMFQSPTPPPVLGCALDSLSGVAVDNLALRGQSTPRLHQTNHDLFKAMVDHLDVGLILFQFGTNMIPTITDDFTFYQIQLQKQLEILKELAPHCPVIVIGTGDAAYLKDGHEVAYDHIASLSAAQKKAAINMNAGFFDLYQAMGGKGAMIEWVNQEPPLAMSDYIHFSKTGGKLVANYITKALLAQAEEYWTDQAIHSDSLKSRF